MVDLPTPDDPSKRPGLARSRDTAAGHPPLPARGRRPRAPGPLPTSARTASAIALWVVNHVRLVQDDHRRRAALVRDEQVSFDPPRVEVAVETGDEEHGVDVRGDDLFFGGSPAARREKRLWRGRTARIRASPPCAGGSSATQSPTAGKSARACAWWRSRPETRASDSPVVGHDAVDMGVFERDARRHQPSAAMRCERRVETIVPAETSSSSLMT